MKNIVFQKLYPIDKTRGNIEITFIFIYMFLIIFILFPLFTYIYEKMYFSIIESEVRDSLEVSISALYKEYRIYELSLGKIGINNESAEFIEYLKENLDLNDNLYAKNTSILFGEIDIISIYFEDSNLLIVLDITIEPFIYRKLFMELTEKNNLIVRINLEVNTPINN